MKYRVLIGCYILFVSGFAVAQQDDPFNHPEPEKMPMMGSPGVPPDMRRSLQNPQPMMVNISELQNMMTEININKNVSDKIIAIARNFLGFLDGRFIKIQRIELDIKEELLKEKPDMQSIQTSVMKKSQLLGDIEMAQIKRDLEIKALLTQEEYDRWKSAMMRKMRESMPRFKEKGGHSPAPEGKESKQK